jgi:5-methylcytosine-specific restriction endonuclease McrA
MLRTIHDYRNHPAYANCPRGFVVTGSNRERDHDQWNREFIGNNETGMWIVAPGRVFQGDAIFVLLPNPERRDGYPRQLFGGVITGWRFEGDRSIFQVGEFIEHSPIAAEIKLFLGGKVPPQGNTVGVVWESPDHQSLPRQSVVNEDFEWQVRRSANLSPEVREARMRAWSPRPERIDVASTAFVRNPHVVATVLSRANGYCEHCEQPAPFMRKSDGTPYLEVHHIQPLGEGGEDTVENAIALCPNCHRKRHFG